jgi:dephospho-CoA kinase
VIKIFIVGITGKIASGKSTVAVMLSNKLPECRILELDSIGKEIYNKDQAVLLKLRDCFGGCVFREDGTVDYKALASIVFSSKESLENLNRIMIPEIEKVVRNCVEKFREEKIVKFLIIDAAILFNTDIYKYCDFIIIVKSDIKKRCRLLMKNRSMDQDEAMARIRGQHIKLKRNIGRAEGCSIENSKDKECLRSEVDRISGAILKLSVAPG